MSFKRWFALVRDNETFHLLKHFDNTFAQNFLQPLKDQKIFSIFHYKSYKNRSQKGFLVHREIEIRPNWFVQQLRLSTYHFEWFVLFYNVWLCVKGRLIFIEMIEVKIFGFHWFVQENSFDDDSDLLSWW